MDNKYCISIFATWLLLISIQTFGQWKQMIGPCSFNRGQLCVKGDRLFAGGDMGIYASLDHGQTWIQLIQGLGDFGNVSSLATRNNTVIACNWGGQIVVSQDTGATWNLKTDGPIAVTCVAINGSDFYAGTFFGEIFCSKDDGESWNLVFDESYLYSPVINCIVARGNRIFAATEIGVYRSIDNGITWERAHSGITGPNAQCLVFKGDTIFAGTFIGGVFFSVNDGLLWSRLINGLSGKPVMSLGVASNNIFAGTHGDGVFLLKNDTTWIPINDGLPMLHISTIDCHANYIFAGGDAIDVYRLDITELLSIEENQPTPKFRVFPVPAKDIIEISTKENFQELNVELFSISGQLLQQIHFNQTPINVDIRGLCSGVYVLILKEKGSIYTFKIII
jgi:hypothetical protein